MKKIFSIYIFLSIIFSSCASATSVPIAETPTQTIRSENLVTHSDLEIITPENVNQLEEIDRWGKGYSRIVFSPDEKFIGVSSPTGIYIYNIETKEETIFVDDENKTDDTAWIKYGYPSPPIAFSSDSRQLAVAVSAQVFIYDIATKKQINSIYATTHDLDLEKIEIIEFSPDNKTILISSILKVYDVRNCEHSAINVSLYKLEERQKIFEYRHCIYGSIYPKFINFNEKNHLSFRDYKDSSLKLVDNETGKINNFYSFANVEFYQTFDISPDGKLLRINYNNENSQILNLDTKEIVEINYQNIKFLGDSFLYYAFDEESLNIISKEKVICKIPFRNGYDSGFFSKQGGYYLLNSRYLWNISKCVVEEALPDFQISSLGRQGSPVFSSDGKSVGVLPRLFNTITGEIESFIDVDRFEVDGLLIYDMDFRKNHKEILILMKDITKKKSQIFYFDTVSGDLIKTQVYDEEISSLSVSPDETKIFTVTNNGEILIIDAESGEIEITSKISYLTKYSRVAVSPDGLNLAFINYFDGSINRIDFIELKTLSIINSVFVHQPNINVIALSPAWDKVAIPRQNGEIHIFTSDMKFVIKILGHSQTQINYNQIRSLTYTPNGRLLISSSYEEIRFWNPETGQLIAELQPDFTYNSFSISPDGYLLAILCSDGTVRVFGVRK